MTNDCARGAALGCHSKAAREKLCPTLPPQDGAILGVGSQRPEPLEPTMRHDKQRKTDSTLSLRHHSLVFLAMVFCLAKSANSTSQSVDALPILFTKVPANLLHGSSHCSEAMIVESPLGAQSKIRSISSALPADGGGKLGAQFDGWLGSPTKASILRISYRGAPDVDLADCEGKDPNRLVLEPFVVDLKSLKVERPTQWSPESKGRADLLSAGCFYYRSIMRVLPGSSPSLDKVWFLGQRSHDVQDDHCKDLDHRTGTSGQDFQMLAAFKDETGRWSMLGKGFVPPGAHPCAIAPNGKAWACESADGLWLGTPWRNSWKVLKTTGLKFAVWHPKSTGFAYVFHANPSDHRTAAIRFVSIEFDADGAPTIGRSIDLASDDWAPAQVCSNKTTAGVRCRPFAGLTANRGNIGSDLPVWSPDANWIYFSAFRKNSSAPFHRALVRVSIDNPKLAEVVFDKEDQEVGHPAVSPTADHVAFLGTRAKHNLLTELFVVKIGSVGARRISRLQEECGFLCQAYAPIWWTPDVELLLTKHPKNR